MIYITHIDNREETVTLICEVKTPESFKKIFNSLIEDFETKADAEKYLADVKNGKTRTLDLEDSVYAFSIDKKKAHTAVRRQFLRGCDFG